MGQRMDAISQLKTDETDTTLVLAPDGTGKVEWRAESGGGGSGNEDGGNASSTYGGTTPADGGNA